MCDESSGHPQDKSGNARHCTASANLTYGVTGPFIGSPNRAISSAGSGTATMPATVTLPGDSGGNVACPVTLVWWHKAPSGSATQGVINLTPTGAGTDRFAVQAPHSDDNVYCDHWDNDDTANGRLTYAYTGKRNAWHMLGFKSSGLFGSPKALIVDSTVVASSINSDAPDTALAGGTLFTTPTGASTSTMAGVALFKTYLSDANIAALNGAGLAPVAVGYTFSVGSPSIAGAATTVTVTATPAGAFFDGSVAITLTPSGTGGSAVVITPGGNTSGPGSNTPATAGAGTLAGTNNGGWSNPSAATFTVYDPPSGEVELLGDVFSSTVSGLNAAANAFDGSFSTFFAGSDANAYIGRDLAVAAVLTRVRIAPRPSLNDGGIDASAYDAAAQLFTIDASNAGPNTTVVTLATKNPAAPFATRNQLTEYLVPYGTTGYRYVRLTSLAVNGHFAEIQFIGRYAAGVLCKPLKPEFGPSGGRYLTGSATLRLATSTGTASIYYAVRAATDPAVNPTNLTGTLYDGPTPITPTAAGIVVEAVCYDPACSTTTSDVATSAPFYSTAVAAGGDDYDNRGILIEAHAGHVMAYAGRYYRYGFSMNRTDSADNVVGSAINCYSSADGMNWTHECEVTGMILSATQMERPHVQYNDATRTFVMWVHAYGGTLTNGRAYCLTSPTPVGPWTLVNASVNPNGVGYHDGYFFKDDDGQGYLLHTPTDRVGLYLSRLTPDYLAIDTGNYVQLTGASDRESPIIFRHYGGTLFVINGKGNFYDRNSTFDVEYVVGVGDDPLTATWGSLPGTSAYAVQPTLGSAFNVQPTTVFRAGDGTYVFAGDYWTGDTVMYDSRQTWSTLSFPTTTTLAIPLTQWTPVAANLGRTVRIVQPQSARVVRPVQS